jgi:hypothetical protein
MRLNTDLYGFAITLLALTTYVLVLAATASGLFSYPPILVSSIFIIGAELLIIHRIGLISVPSLFWAFVGVPALIPLLADYVFYVPNYTFRAAAYSDPVLIRKGIFLVAIFLWIVVGFCLAQFKFVERSSSSPVEFISKYTFPYTHSAFATVSGIVLVSAYLTTPGPTILTHSYAAVIDNYIPWATFAGSLYMGSWIVLLLIARQTEERSVNYVFYLITIVSVLWLLLHARRNESLGVLLTALIIYGHDFRIRDLGSSIRTTFFALVFIIAIAIQVLVGEIRSGSAEIDLRSIFVSESPDIGGVIKLPGGGHNIFGTYQFTLHHFAENKLLAGMTFAKYPIQSVPTPILRLFGVSPPSYYFDLMRDHYPLYNGGSYLLNEYLANFGSFGIVIAGFLFGFLVLKVQETITRSANPTLWKGFAAAFIVALPRSTWYWQGNWINALQAVLVTYALYIAVVNIKLYFGFQDFQ